MLTEDEKELGVALVDSGAARLTSRMMSAGACWYTAVIGPLAATTSPTTSRSAFVTPVPDAEKIKRKCGCVVRMADEDETTEVASVGGRKPRADGAPDLRRSFNPAPRRSSKKKKKAN